MSLPETPSQTVGPYFAIGLSWADGEDVVPEGTDGAIWLRGRLFDGEGAAIPDAMLETWQADPDGRFGESFRGFGRVPTDAADRVLAALDPDARATLVATPAGDGYAHDIHLQGPHATAFFAL